MRILMAIHQKLFRDALALYLQNSLPELDIAEVSTFAQALKYLGEKDDLDLLLFDLELPGMNGLDGLGAIRQAAPDARLTLLAERIRPAEVAAAFDRGAAGILSKDLSGRVMLKALEIVLSGERYVPVSGLLLPERASADAPNGAGAGGAFDPENPLSRLTPRERDVLDLLVKGLPNRQIADRLKVKDITISFHLKGLFRKLEATNRTQAATTALRLGWSA